MPKTPSTLDGACGALMDGARDGRCEQAGNIRGEQRNQRCTRDCRRIHNVGTPLPPFTPRRDVGRCGHAQGPYRDSWRRGAWSRSRSRSRSRLPAGHRRDNRDERRDVAESIDHAHLWRIGERERDREREPAILGAAEAQRCERADEHWHMHRAMTFSCVTSNRAHQSSAVCIWLHYRILCESHRKAVVGCMVSLQSGKEGSRFPPSESFRDLATRRPGPSSCCDRALPRRVRHCVQNDNQWYVRMCVRSCARACVCVCERLCVYSWR
jgi:hypothetical protein